MPLGTYIAINKPIIAYFWRINTSKETEQMHFSEGLLAAEATTLPFSGGKGPERAETALRNLCHRSLRTNGFVLLNISRQKSILTHSGHILLIHNILQ